MKIREVCEKNRYQSERTFPRKATYCVLMYTYIYTKIYKYTLNLICNMKGYYLKPN